MITNKDLFIDSENGKIVLNGDKYDLGTQGEIDTAVKDVYSVMGKNGAKNLNSYPYNETSHTDNGIAWTDNGDGTVTANNTATGNSGFVCHSRVLSSDNKLIVPNGTYILSGCPSGGSSTTFNIGATITKNGSAMALGTDNGSGAIITINGDDNYTDKAIVQIICNIKRGVAASNLTFKPMLRLAADTDNTYEPYAMTNKQLTDQVETIKGLIDGIRPSAGNLAGEVLTLSGTQDNALVFNETGNDDYKGMIVNDKDGNERYRLYFTGGHVKFLSKAADGTTIIDTTLA